VPGRFFAMDWGVSATLTVIDADEAHLAGIAEIYAVAARDTPATFDLEGLPLSSWRSALSAVDPVAGNFLLAAVGDAGEVLGYAKSGRYRERPAYATTREVSVYVAEAARGRGVGRALYDALLARLGASDARLAVAGVGEPNPASTALHLACGFTVVGTFVGVGTKFGRSWDVTWYQRPLSAPSGR
jgi:L-amino acid N-acyltransferase YncA